jgi:hypothetical protein
VTAVKPYQILHFHICQAARDKTESDRSAEDVFSAGAIKRQGANSTANRRCADSGEGDAQNEFQGKGWGVTAPLPRSVANDRAKVDQIMKQCLAACAKLDVETETDASFREAIDMVVSGNWEPDRELDRPDPRWRYETHIPPIKEAAWGGDRARGRQTAADFLGQLSLAYRNNQRANQQRSGGLSRFVRFGIQAATARRAWRCSQIALTALIASS